MPPRDLTLRPVVLESEDPREGSTGPASTSAFQPFGTRLTEETPLEGEVRGNGAILRCGLDGSELEVYAWGLRNPFGLAWSADGKLYASENGFDARGSRPIANDPEDLYLVREGAWYGWPDYAAGVPVTDPRFRPEEGPAPELLLADPPPVEAPLLTFPPHSAVAKLAVAPADGFGGRQGDLFLALFGHMAPMTGEVEEHGGHRVVRIDPATRAVETVFARKGDHGGHATEAAARATEEEREGRSAGAEGHGEPGAGTKEPAGYGAGPRRPIDVAFAPDGSALYVVDFGVLRVDANGVHPVAGTGVVWRVTRAGALDVKPPAGLSAESARER